jgi:hypothetical protein
VGEARGSRHGSLHPRAPRFFAAADFGNRSGLARRVSCAVSALDALAADLLRLIG